MKSQIVRASFITFILLVIFSSGVLAGKGGITRECCKAGIDLDCRLGEFLLVFAARVAQCVACLTAMAFDVVENDGDVGQVFRTNFFFGREIDGLSLRADQQGEQHRNWHDEGSGN